MAGVNKAILIGNLGRDPEVSYTPSGVAVAKFSIATSEKWKDKNSGEMQERTEWHRITAFGRLAEICGEYLSKGKQVYIEGRLQTSSWEKDGITKYMTEIIASEMRMLGGRDTAAAASLSAEAGAPERPGPSFSEGPDDEIPF